MPCTTILVGKKASFDGSTMISRNDDGPFEAKKVIIVPSDKQVRKYKSVIGHLEIDLPDNPMRYSACPSVSKTRGVWAACGINEANVAMNATETITSNPRVYGSDPLVKYKKATKKGEKDIPGGLGEEDLVTVVLPYIKSAREGVLRLGSLLEKYGTYEMNGIAFSDENEIWWFESIGGHHFIARRVPDDKVVIMPNQFGLDNFDFDDAFGPQKEHICSKDLKEFIEKNHLYLGKGKDFNPRLAFGSHADSDHIYNTPRAWFLINYFAKELGRNYTPESDDIPWMFTPDNLVTIEDLKYVLSSYYQGTNFNPYGKADVHGKYRSIGVPNSDVSSIQQIRGYLPNKIKAIEWISLGGSGFTSIFPLYTNVNSFPSYVSGTTLDVSTNHMYWASRLFAALVDANYSKTILYADRYQLGTMCKAREILARNDALFVKTNDLKLLEKANQETLDMIKSETDKAIKSVLDIASNSMKTRYNRGDN